MLGFDGVRRRRSLCFNCSEMAYIIDDRRSGRSKIVKAYNPMVAWWRYLGGIVKAGRPNLRL